MPTSEPSTSHAVTYSTLHQQSPIPVGVEAGVALAHLSPLPAVAAAVQAPQEPVEEGHCWEVPRVVA